MNPTHLDPTGLYWGEEMPTIKTRKLQWEHVTILHHVTFRTEGKNHFFGRWCKSRIKRHRAYKGRRKRRKKEVEARVFLMKAAAKTGGDETQRSAVSGRDTRRLPVTASRLCYHVVSAFGKPLQKIFIIYNVILWCVVTVCSDFTPHSTWSWNTCSTQVFLY
jgi:hypothetical protein